MGVAARSWASWGGSATRWIGAVSGELENDDAKADAEIKDLSAPLAIPTYTGKAPPNLASAVGHCEASLRSSGGCGSTRSAAR